MRKLLYIFLAFVSFAILQGCSAVGYVHWPVEVPPEVIVPEHVYRLAVVNRALAGDAQGEKVITIAEAFLSGEGIKEDRNGSVACITGAASQLNLDGVVEAVALDSIFLPGTGTGVMPLPLNWNEVTELCNEYEVDALLVLEVFDTDQQGSVTSNAVGQIVTMGTTGKPAPVPPVTNSSVFVKTAWRLYDPAGKVIIDEYRLNDAFGVSSHPFDLGEFAKRDAIQQSAYIAGRVYANRMLPGSMRVRRDMYKRKGPNMKIAWRMVEVNDWDEAIAQWKMVSNDPRKKVGGRACYNLAVAYEVKGDIPAAIEWAKRAHTVYNEPRSQQYVKILQRLQ